MEVLEHGRKKERYNMEIGTKVRVNGNELKNDYCFDTMEDLSVFVGAVGEVVQEDLGDNTICVKFDNEYELEGYDNGDTWWFDTNNLDVVEE